MFFTIPNFLERMLEEPLSPLTVLSISAIITTISLFFCGIPICLQIYRRSSTHEISGFPFLMGFLGGAFWLRYGLLKADLTMVTVNVVGVSLMFLYLLFYLYYSRPRTGFLFQLLIVKTMVAIMLVLVHLYGLVSLQALGFVCMTFNIINFGAPLAGLTVVLRNRSCSTLPLPLCVANLLVSSQWCIYGVCVHDIYIIIPNGTGIVLALVQISLFMVFPRQEGDHAPLAKCCPCILDMEKAYEGGLIADVDIDNINNANGTNGRRRRSDKIRDDSNQTDSLRARRNKFLHRQRVIDRRMIPTTRTACIEFLRANGGGGGFDASFGSVSSRATADSWMSNSGASISTRIFSSTSHPELFNGTAVQHAADLDGAIVVDVAQNPTNPDLIDANANAGNAAMMPSLTQSQYNLCVPSSTLANAAVNGFGTTMKSSSRADESQLLTEVPENGNANVGIAHAGEERGGADLLFVRTLSAPDLLAQQSRRS